MKQLRRITLSSSCSVRNKKNITTQSLNYKSGKYHNWKCINDCREKIEENKIKALGKINFVVVRNKKCRNEYNALTQA